MKQCRAEHSCAQTTPTTWRCMKSRGHKGPHEADETHDNHAWVWLLEEEKR